MTMGACETRTTQCIELPFHGLHSEAPTPCISVGIFFVLGCLVVTTGSPHQLGIEQRQFRGQRDLDYSAPRVRWLRTPLRGKAKAQGTRPSKLKKGMHLIGNSREIAARVWTTSVGFRQGIGHLPVSIT